jgi:hypothetical protein
MTTYEEAKRCPKCAQPGDEVADESIKAPGLTRGARLKHVMCMNSRCKWYKTSYYIQVNPDGTIPPPIEHRQKRFTERPSDGGRTEANLLKQLNLEQSPGAEVRGRY